MSTKWRSLKGGVASFAVDAWLSFIVNMVRDVMGRKPTCQSFINRLFEDVSRVGLSGWHEFAFHCVWHANWINVRMGLFLLRPSLGAPFNH